MVIDPVQLATVLMSSGSLLTGAVMVWRSKSQNRKDDAEGDKAGADAGSVVSAAALSLLVPFKEELSHCQKELTSVRTQLRKSEQRAAAAEVTNDRISRKADRLERQLNGALIEVAELRDINNRYRDAHGPLPA